VVVRIPAARNLDMTVGSSWLRRMPPIDNPRMVPSITVVLNWPALLKR